MARGAERKMKKIDLGQTIGIVANVGVIAGLLLLAFELNQNREITEAQTRHQVSQSMVDQFFGYGGQRRLGGGSDSGPDGKTPI